MLSSTSMACVFFASSSFCFLLLEGRSGSCDFGLGVTAFFRRGGISFFSIKLFSQSLFSSYELGPALNNSLAFDHKPFSAEASLQAQCILDFPTILLKRKAWWLSRSWRAFAIVLWVWMLEGKVLMAAQSSGKLPAHVKSTALAVRCSCKNTRGTSLSIFILSR